MVYRTTDFSAGDWHVHLGLELRYKGRIMELELRP
jgi:hypothetical protein